MVKMLLTPAKTRFFKMSKNHQSFLDDLIFVAFVTLVLMGTVRIVSKNIHLSPENTQLLTSKISEFSPKH